MRKKTNKKIVFRKIYLSICTLLVLSIIFIKLNSDAFSGSDKIIIPVSYPQTQDKKIKTNNKIEDENKIEEESNVSEIQLVKPTVTFKVQDVVVQIPIAEETTVYDVMKIASSENEITFEGREYSGLGFFVNQIGSLKNGNGKNLMYYINNKEASVGVSSYVVKEGDIIEWKLK